MTIQTGGTLNAVFLSAKLIDHVDLVVAPILVGGKDTPTLIDGESPRTLGDLDRLGVLRLDVCDMLEDSWLRLRHTVVNASAATK